MSIFYLGPLVGPLLLSLVGGILTERFGWKNIIWFLPAQGASVFALVVVALPETLSLDRRLDMPPTDLTLNNMEPQSVREIDRSGHLSKCHRLLQPLIPVTTLLFPAVFITVFLASMAFGLCSVLIISLQAAFSQSPYRYSHIIVGILFLPSSLGCIIASIFGGGWVDRIMVQNAERARRYEDQGPLLCLPEDRLGPNAYTGLTIYPFGLIAYGWAIQYGVDWAVPSVAGFLFGVGVMMIFSATTAMAAEFLPQNSSIGVAVNKLMRNIFSCVSTIATQPLIDRIGHGWFFTTVGLFAYVTGYLSILLLKSQSGRWRLDMEASKERYRWR